MHIIGASGHAKVVIDILLEREIPVDGIWDDNIELRSLKGFPIKGNFSEFLKSSANSVIIAIGNNSVRKKLAEKLQFTDAMAIHPKSVVSKSSHVGIGTVIMANATVNADTRIGIHGIINTNSSVDHDCEIDDYVHISPHVGLAGNVSVGEGTHIGIGASIIQGIKIGKWATIGAGAVVIRDVPDYAIVVGNPGKIIKYNSL